MYLQFLNCIRYRTVLRIDIFFNFYNVKMLTIVYRMLVHRVTYNNKKK